MKRKIIEIDEHKCTGCGLCIDACHEGAIQLIDGKAKLISETYCDGLGNCLPECPVDAIRIIEREAEAFDEAAVQKRMAGQQTSEIEPMACGCPGTLAKLIKREAPVKKEETPARPAHEGQPIQSQLGQWPIQIQLVPVGAPYLENCDLLVAADCTAYAYANIHNDFMRNKVTLIGCPKLDDADYAEKLTDILNAHEIKRITVLRMEVPCCGGIVNSVKQAMLNSGKLIPWQVVTIGTDGEIIEA